MLQIEMGTEENLITAKFSITFGSFKRPLENFTFDRCPRGQGGIKIKP